MKMKRYFAADSRQALRDLRDEQGPDAVILSNRRVNGGVEIIAAMDYEDSMVSSSLGNPSRLAADPLSAIDPYKNDSFRVNDAVKNAASTETNNELHSRSVENVSQKPKLKAASKYLRK